MSTYAQFYFTFLFFSISCPCLATHSHSSNKIKMVVDTDGVADDIQALTMALQHPDVDILLVTTVVGSTTAPQAVANVARTLRANKVQKHVSIVKGAEANLIGHINTTADVLSFFGHDGLSNKPEAEPKAHPADQVAAIKDIHAAEALVQVLKLHRGEAVLVAIGPLTNLALALELDPEFAKYPKKLVLTGGNIYGMGNVRTNSTAEYNFNADPEAAAIVLQRMKCPITIVAWETTFFFQDLLGKNYDFDRHLQLNYPLAHYFSAITEMPRAVMGNLSRQYRYCDEIAMAVAIDPSVVTTEKKTLVAVEIHGSLTRGQLVVGWLSDWVPMDTEILQKMAPAQLVLDYNFDKVDKLMIDAIKNVKPTLGEKQADEYKENKVEEE